jgi:hypothetical protein
MDWNLANAGTVTLDIVATVNFNGVYANTATPGAETERSSQQQFHNYPGTGIPKRI